MITYVTVLSGDMKKTLAAFLGILVLVTLLAATSGSFLIVDRPEPADVILVLAGETDRRPARALDLLRKGYAPRVLLDVPQGARIYDRQILTIAQSYVDALPERQQIGICPIKGLSTKAESKDVAQCFADAKPQRILVVTSDYHTRRALSVFRHEFPQCQISVAAATDSTQFGAKWWQYRQWAKINFDEWLRLVWWETVDRWR